MRKTTVYTNNENINFNVRYIYKLDEKLTTTRKPMGLWYSFDDDWKNQLYVMEWEAKKYFIEIDIDYSEILVIDGFEDYKKFIEKYSVQINEHIKNINWYEVAVDYKGIEVRDWQGIKSSFSIFRRQIDNSLDFFNDFVSNGFAGWDVDSGCIWDLSCVTQKDVIKDDGFSEKFLKEREFDVEKFFEKLNKVAADEDLDDETVDEIKEKIKEIFI